MNDDIEQLLGRMTPRGVRPELRSQVLAAVVNELAAELASTGAPDSLSIGAAKPQEDVGDARSASCACGTPIAELLGPPLARPATEPSSPWLCRSALAVAASLVVGIAMNIWANEASKRHLAQLFGPPPISKQAMEVAKAVEEITDAQTGQWVYERLTAPRPSGDFPAKYYAAVERLIRELQSDTKDTYHEPTEKDSEMDRDRTGRAGGAGPDGQCHIRVDYRCTA